MTRPELNENRYADLSIAPSILWCLLHIQPKGNILIPYQNWGIFYSISYHILEKRLTGPLTFYLYIKCNNISPVNLIISN